MLTPEEYERLDASRRQIGAKNTKIHTLSHELHQASSLLAEIEHILNVEHDVDDDVDHRAPCGLRMALLDIVRGRHTPAPAGARRHRTET
jgi:hypothetical protein